MTKTKSSSVKAVARKHPIEHLHAPKANSLSVGDSDCSRTDVASDYELTGIPLVLITRLSVSIFLMSLDSSTSAAAIPRITSEFFTDDIYWLIRKCVFLCDGCFAACCR